MAAPNCNRGFKIVFRHIGTLDKIQGSHVAEVGNLSHLYPPELMVDGRA